MLRRQMKHVMFTEPEIIKAGERVTLYYNPDDTLLAGSRYAAVWGSNGTLCLVLPHCSLAVHLCQNCLLCGPLKACLCSVTGLLHE